MLCSQPSSCIPLITSSVPRPGGGKSSSAWEAALYLQLSSLSETVCWWQQQVHCQQPRWLQPTSLAGEEATAQPSPMEGKRPARREGEQWCAGVTGRSAARRSCPNKMVSHKKSRERLKLTWFDICQRRTQKPLSVPWGLGETVKQGYAGAELSPTAHSCFTIVESLTYKEEFFLVDLYDFLWRGIVLWALCFFTHLLKSPILGHPNSSSQEELDSASGLLRSGCSRAK